jgi:large subunit ribosomal protein L4
MKLEVLNLDNKKVGEAELNASLFGHEERADILYRVIHWQMAKRRAGTHSVKERGDVSGSTRKIYRQKGTGGARHGGIRGAQFRGGGIIFGPVVRDHGYKLNKKVRKLALKIALSMKLRSNSLVIVDSLQMDSHKTAVMKKKISALGCDSALFIDKEVNANFKLSISNLHKVDILPQEALNILDIVSHEKVVMTLDALKTIEARLI